MNRGLLIGAVVAALAILVGVTVGEEKEKAAPGPKAAAPEAQVRGEARREVERPRLREPNEARPGGPGAGLQRGRDQEAYLGAIDQEIKGLKDRRGQFIAELKAIHAIALQEKAKKTAEKLEQLIAKQQESLDKDVGKLEQRRQSLKETLGRGEPGRVDLEELRKRRLERRAGRVREMGPAEEDQGRPVPRRRPVEEPEEQ